jgi:hypothetical protein
LNKKLKILFTREFNYEMLNIFLEFHDLHMRYIMSDIYASKFASLGFILEEYYEDNIRRYVVTYLYFLGIFLLPENIE